MVFHLQKSGYFLRKSLGFWVKYNLNALVGDSLRRMRYPNKGYFVFSDASESFYRVKSQEEGEHLLGMVDQSKS